MGDFSNIATQTLAATALATGRAAKTKINLESVVLLPSRDEDASGRSFGLAGAKLRRARCRASDHFPVWISRSRRGNRMRSLSVFLATAALRTLGMASLAAVTLAASAAHASLPPASGFAECNSGDGAISNSTGCDVGTDRASVSLSPFAVVSASGEYPGSLARVQSSAYAVEDYSFEVVGGQAGDLVQLNVDSILSAVTAGGGYAFSEIVVTSNEGSVGETICSSGCGVGDGMTSFVGELQIGAQSGAIGSIHLEVEGGGNFSQFANSGAASADPFLFVEEPGYSILLSDGVVNGLPQAGGVPEPTMWAMLLIGFGGVGAALRHRRSRSTQLAI